jgi:hypothetical protein
VHTRNEIFFLNVHSGETKEVNDEGREVVNLGLCGGNKSIVREKYNNCKIVSIRGRARYISGWKKKTRKQM